MSNRANARLDNALQTASDELEEQIGEIKDDLGRLREVLSDVITKGGAVVSSQFATAREAVKGKASNWLEVGQQVADQTLERAKESEADFEEVVQLHPIMAVAAAVGIGLVIGALLTSGTRR